jgi:hypothetical protein
VKAESLEQYPQTNQTGPWATYGKGRTTVWTVKFNVAKQEHGEAYLRVSLAVVNGLRDGLAVGLSGQSIGAIGDGSDADNARLITTNSIRYNADKGLNQQRTLKFDAGLLKPGENEMTFTVPVATCKPVWCGTTCAWNWMRIKSILGRHSLQPQTDGEPARSEPTDSGTHHRLTQDRSSNTKPKLKTPSREAFDARTKPQTSSVTGSIRLPLSQTLSRTELPSSELRAHFVPERGRHPRVVQTGHSIVSAAPG